jgi:hypothetical protein
VKELVRCVGIAVTVFTLAIATAVPVQAQTTADFSGGYQYTHDPGFNMPGGWYADVAVPVNSMWAVFGEINGAYKNGVRQHVYGGGIRVLGVAPSVRPFAQILFGGETISISNCSSCSETAFAMQFGGGVNIPMDARWGIRLGADYRPVFFEGDTENQFRFVIGVVFPGR